MTNYQENYEAEESSDASVETAGGREESLRTKYSDHVDLIEDSEKPSPELQEDDFDLPRALEGPPGDTPLKLKFKKRFSNVGIDLGDDFIKLVQFRNVKGQPQLQQYHFLPFPEGAMDEEGERVADPSMLSKRIGTPFKKRRYKNRRVNLCISGSSVILRQVFLPYMPLKELPNAVRWEAEKHIMVPLKELVLDFFTVGERIIDGNRVLEVVLVAVLRDTVNSYLKALTMAGLYPEVVEIDALALRRATGLSLKSGGQVCFEEDDVDATPVQKQNQTQPQTLTQPQDQEQEQLQTVSGEPVPSVDLTKNYLVLDIGRCYSTLLLMKETSYSFTRTINLGVIDFVEQLMEKHDLSRNKAENVIYKSGVFELEGIPETAEMLVDQVNRSLEYYYYKMYHQGMDFQRLLICGEGVFIRGLAWFLGENLNASPCVLNPLHHFKRNSRFRLEDINQDGPSMVATCGAALRGWLR